MLIQYKIYHTTNLYTFQSNLLLERNQSNCFVSSPQFVQEGLDFQSKTPYFVATFLFHSPFSRSFKALHFSARDLCISFRKNFCDVFLPKNRIKRSNFRTFEFWPNVKTKVRENERSKNFVRPTEICKILRVILPKEVRNGQGTEEFVVAIKTFEKLRIQFSGVNCNDAFVELFFFLWYDWTTILNDVIAS